MYLPQQHAHLPKQQRPVTAAQVVVHTIVTPAAIQDMLAFTLAWSRE